MKRATHKHLVLWDGDCDFCRRSIGWLEQRSRGEMEFMPYQQAPALLVSEELRLACAEAVHVITRNGRILGGAEAWLFMLRAIGWRTVAILLETPPLFWFLRALSKWVMASSWRSNTARQIPSL